MAKEALKASKNLLDILVRRIEKGTVRITAKVATQMESQVGDTFQLLIVLLL